MVITRICMSPIKNICIKHVLSVDCRVNFVRFCWAKPLVDISDPAVLRYLEDTKKEYWTLKTSHARDRRTLNTLQELSPLVKLIEEKNCIIDNLKNLNEIGNERSEKDKDMLELMEEEKEVYEGILKDLNNKIIDVMFNDNDKYEYTDTILEVSAGVGGQEAMLFAREMFDMYVGYAQYKKWNICITHVEKTSMGGVKKAIGVFSGNGSYELLQSEGGVHRVQRIPVTEKAGRLHTSTITVAVLLQPTEIELSIPENDIKIETKRATGAGGQHVNTTDSAVRVTHLPTRLQVECQTERDQHQNKRKALERLRALLYQQQLEQQEKQEKSSRKSQVGLGFRNEKIRTYNFQQDRVTDHRIGASNGTLHGIDILLKGGEPLDKLIYKLRRHIKTQNVLQTIEDYRKQIEIYSKKL